MTISSNILRSYPDLNPAQRKVIGHLDGPLLVIAGPGSGKTYSIVLRALNLLLLEKAVAREIVLCTFTEKAAFEMRDRIFAAAQKVNYGNDLSELRVTTIHGLCNHFISQHRHHTQLGSSYETLDELMQLLFIFEHFDEIIGPADEGLFLGRWKTKWTAIKGAQGYFDKITEELVDVDTLSALENPFLKAISEAYRAYETALYANNRLDFAHLQSIVHGLLKDEQQRTTLTSDIHYLLVDEYQDTNTVQEQLLLKLSANSGNLCVVGDEDQSLYRFRGATVRNILEFPNRFQSCPVVRLATNYRSHRSIIGRYDTWMASIDWTNPRGTPFRFDKTIEADPDGDHTNYPAVISIWGRDARDEAERFADLAMFLKANHVVEDYSQIALLLHSVREDHSHFYISALEARGIPVFCPRARTYFENHEIRLMVGCFALLFGWHGDGRGQVKGVVATLARYVDQGLVDLARGFAPPHPLALRLRRWIDEIAAIEPGQSLDMRPADYFYRLVAMEPFVTALKAEDTARNLALFSRLLNIFQNYYHYTVVTHANREYLRFHLFSSFLRLLYDGGINEYEDPDRPLPKGFVQAMTIHQAKGLEFPVVVVGSLSKQLSSPKGIDRDLSPFYHRPPFEPERRITLFDRMRLHYVAFSRPQKLLVLTSHETPKPHFASIWQGLPQWPYVETDLLAAQRFALRNRMPVKKSYSFTGDLKIYETCPRQYQFFREYDFTPSRSAVIFFGLLVHQTIEEIHRIVLDGKLHTLNRAHIEELFEQTFRFLSLSDVRPIGRAAKEGAFNQVMNYFNQNRMEMQRVIQTEVDVSLEKDGYILVGKVDLLLGSDGKLELLDFKTSERSTDPHLLATYEDQLCTYAHILEQRHGKHPERLLLYWTAEAHKADALMELPYRREKVEGAGRRFDRVVSRIQSRDFVVAKTPESKVCKECDLRSLCTTEGIVKAAPSGERLYEKAE